MYRKSNEGDPPSGNLTNFPLWEVKGRWRSREGSPDVRIFQSRRSRSGGYYVEFTYRTGHTYRRPIKKWWCWSVRYFNLYGFVGLAYDPERDVLQLSHYGDYYRAKD